MNHTYKALAALLMYPDEVLLKNVSEIFSALALSNGVAAEHWPRLNSLRDYLTATDPWTIQEAYVERFDTGRSTSLHLFEHVHGESKDRGQAMVDLKAHYEAAGLNLAPNELPDFLPVFLEYLSLLPPDEAAGLLGECSHVLEVIGERLLDRGSPWGAIFPVLLDHAETPSGESLPAVLSEKTLDEEWAEEPAFSGAACTGVQ